LILKFIPAVSLSSASTEIVGNQAGKYFASASNMLYLFILFLPGVIWSYFKKKRLTLLIVLPSLVMLTGIFSLDVFALRYAYFFGFPLVLYSSLLMSFFYEKYGKGILIALIILLLIPSNLFFPYTYVNTILPIKENSLDYSAPATDYKSLPLELVQEMKSNITVISYFSSDVEWYIKKPSYVLPFSMDGKGTDEISFNNSKGELVDRYSGSPILTFIPKMPYYLIADSFSVSKLKPTQRELLSNLTMNCTIEYSHRDLKVYFCSALLP
jgi:hypothetical protein